MTANIRKWFYLLSGLVSAVVPILVSLNVTTADQSQLWLQLLTALGGVVGATGLGTAAVVVHKQQKDGTLSPAPAPADQAINAIQETVNAAEQAKTELDRVRQSVSDVLGGIPALGPLAQAAINSLPKF